MAFGRGPNIITDGLVLALDAGSHKSYPGSGTTWYDLSGNSNNGTLINGPTFSNGSILFDGVNDYVTTLTNYAFGVNPFTISGWARAYENQVSRFPTIICVGSTGTSANWQVDFSDGIFTFRAGTTSISTTHILDGKWLFFSIVRESTLTGGLKIYVYNTLNTSATATNNFSEVSNYKIGTNRNENHPFQGDISNLLVYNQALTASEVLQNYNATKSRFNL